MEAYVATGRMIPASEERLRLRGGVALVGLSVAGLGARLLSFAAFAPMLSLGIGVAMMGQR